jgi:hypothetical protein
VAQVNDLSRSLTAFDPISTLVVWLVSGAVPGVSTLRLPLRPCAPVWSSPTLSRVKAFAVTAATHLSSAPDIPTVDEAGLPGFYASVWHGQWAPMRPLPCHASSTARA